MLAAFCGLWIAYACGAEPSLESAAFTQAEANGERVREGLSRCERFLHAWLGAADPVTGLIPRNLIDSPYWNGKDSAADNYPFLVLSAQFTDRDALAGPLRRMLEAEQRLTRRDGWLRLTDDYRLREPRGLLQAQPDATRLFFNSAEYVKDGLLALTEWLGPSPWSERMFGLIEDSFALASQETPYGRVPLAGRNREPGVEVSGDYLQALARLYWMRGGDERYLEWGARLAQFYLLPEAKHHPTRDFTHLGLRDHGCEIVSGLCEFYATLSFAGQRPDGGRWAKLKATLQPHVHEMLDRILAVGRNEHGLFFNAVNPQTGDVVDSRLSDSWGYVLDAYYTVYLVDRVERYRDAAFQPLGALAAHYRRYNWEPRRDDPPGRLGSQDGYADSIESALNLANRLPPADPRARAAFEWIDNEIVELWSRQQPDGFIERWHGDGNFARTTIMYCLWKTQGVTFQPWREDVRLGAVRDGETLRIVVAAEKPWKGQITLDRPRHTEYLRLPIDWPRINQFPEWFTVRGNDRLQVRVGGETSERALAGESLRSGLAVELPGPGKLAITISR